MPGTGRERREPKKVVPRRRVHERTDPDRHSTKRATTPRRSLPNGDEGEADTSRHVPRGPEPDSARRRPAVTARKAARCAALQVEELTGKQPEGVTSLERRDDGWQVGIEVVETHRIPDSTDILAVYRVELDEEGELVSYHRADRYYRGRANEQ